MYNTLLGEASFYSIDRLEKWIKEKTYLQAVEVQYRWLRRTVTATKLSYDADWFDVKEGWEAVIWETTKSLYGVNEVECVVQLRKTIFDHEICLEGL
jgi:hypothetical protein